MPRHRNRHRRIALLLIALATLGSALGAAPAAVPAAAQTLTNLFFLHHSTGRNLIAEGGVRPWLEAYNVQHGTGYEFWDHDYNYIGLMDPDGVLTGTRYYIPGDNTDPDGLWTLWTTENDAREAILASHEVIAFKSCYPASHIADLTELNTRKTWYLEMRDVFDQHPEKLFVVVSQPPLHRLDTDTTEADLARAFANWLKSAEYLAGHDNVVCFDLFDAWAHPDDGSAVRNMLLYDYERSHASNDSHPNELANQVVGPLFIDFLVRSTSPLAAADGPPAARATLAQNVPNPFNPLTRIPYALAADGPVRLRIYDLGGRLVRTLVDGRRAAGAHAALWDGRDRHGRAVGSGVYVYRLSAGSDVLSRKLILAR